MVAVREKYPNMTKTRSGPAAGNDAAFAWEDNNDVGKGRLAIVESTLPSKITMSLDMLEPFAAHNIVEFTLEPKGDTTDVTWAMQGRVPYLAKIVHAFIDMDEIVGKDFEAGLAALKAMAEK